MLRKRNKIKLSRMIYSNVICIQMTAGDPLLLIDAVSAIKPNNRAKYLRRAQTGLSCWAVNSTRSHATCRTRKAPTFGEQSAPTCRLQIRSRYFSCQLIRSTHFIFTLEHLIDARASLFLLFFTQPNLLFRWWSTFRRTKKR